MKDLNWEKRAQKLQLGPLKRKLFITQLLRDVKLLVRMNIMDYSLMIGVHDIVRGNKDNVRNSTLQTFQVIYCSSKAIFRAHAYYFIVHSQILN